VREDALVALHLHLLVGDVVEGVVLLILLAHLQEHVLQVAVAEALGEDVHVGLALVQIRKHLALRIQVFLVEFQFHFDLVLFLQCSCGLLAQEVEQCVGLKPDILFDGEFVAPAVLVLEEQAGPAAADLALAHDGDAVAQLVGLVHVVGSEDDSALLLDLLKDVPQLLA